MATLLPNVKLQFLDDNGAPLAGGLLYSYVAGTTTPLATFTDQSEVTPNTNPVVLDANGMATVWIGEASYKLTLADALDSPLWTVDNVASIFDGSVTTLKLGDHAVTTVKMAIGVLSADLAGRALMASQFIQTAHIGDKQVTAGKLADNTLTPTQMATDIGIVPTGAVISTMVDVGSVMDGWLLCDGSSYLRSDYPALYAAILSASGIPDATHFNVPDLRGYFLRGRDQASGHDPDVAGRTAQATGGNTGDDVGTVQADQYASHSHVEPLKDASGNGTVAQGTNGTTSTGNGTTASAGGSETRPKNVAVNFIIKT